MTVDTGTLERDEDPHYIWYNLTIDRADLVVKGEELREDDIEGGPLWGRIRDNIRETQSSR